MKHVISLLTLLLPFAASAKQFEIFDGRVYNGLYYPMIDIIEWGEADGELPHIEFHIHSKDKRIEVSAVPGDKNGKPVLWIMYDLPFRNERVCRHVLAPSHFREGMKLYAYRDLTDGDYDNIYVSSQPVNLKKFLPYEMPAYERCQDENASNMPEPANRLPASPSSAGSQATIPGPAEKKDGKNVGPDYDNHAVPFSF